MKLSFSFDHRILDGALSSDILSAIKEELENLEGEEIEIDSTS